MQGLADEAGLDKSTIWKLEHGRRGIGEDVLFSLAEALDVHPMQLFGDDRWSNRYIKGHIKMGEPRSGLLWPEEEWQVVEVPRSNRFPEAHKFLLEDRDTSYIVECVDDHEYVTALQVGKRYVVEFFPGGDSREYFIARLKEGPEGRMVLAPERANGSISCPLLLDDTRVKIAARIIRSVIDE